MQLVRESINFTRGMDPKIAMGIGKIKLIENAFKNIAKEDAKHYYVGGSTSPGNIMAFHVTPTRFIIKFYSNELTDPITHKKINRKNYAIDLVMKAGIGECFFDVDYDYKERQWIVFKMNLEDRKYFKKIRGHHYIT
jgi:hypothetical protein